MIVFVHLQDGFVKLRLEFGACSALQTVKSFRGLECHLQGKGRTAGYVRSAWAERPTGRFSFSRIGRDSVNTNFWKELRSLQNWRIGLISS
jgi:hypothetical protein